MYYAPSERSIDRQRHAITNRHSRFRTRHSRNHRNRELLSDWTVYNDVRSSQADCTLGRGHSIEPVIETLDSVETIGKRVKLKKSNGRQKDTHHDEDTKCADWTPANNHTATFNSVESSKRQNERDELRESRTGRGDDTKCADWTQENNHAATTGRGDDTKCANWTPVNNHAATFNLVESNKSDNERNELRESRTGRGDDTKCADWTPTNNHTATFNSVESSKSNNERDKLRESRTGRGDDTK
eukprot:scaffold40125_cov54-Attheya_sp.AAC.2